MNESNVDVVVVGAGPSGLTVAGELAQAGLDVVVLERRTGSVQSRAGTILPRVLELLDARGLAQSFIERARTIRENPLIRTHIWAGMQPVEWRHLGSHFGYRLILPQNHTEELLGNHASRMGARVVHDATVSRVEQDANEVRVTYADGSGTEGVVTARYAVGADGGRSTVRRLSDIDFVGHDATFTGIVADLAIKTPYKGNRRMTDNERGWVTSFPFGTDDDPVTRFNMVHVESRKAAPSEPVTVEEVRRNLHEILDVEVNFEELRWASRFSDTMRLADTFRARRVLLVGESARIHYPASGVGMNFCIQDAFNLGWKLAAVLRGHASSTLLDTYQSERRRVAELLLDSVRSQCAIQFDFTPEGVAFKRMFERDLMPLSQVNTYLARDLNGLTEPYPSPEDSHELTGRPMPDVTVQTSEDLIRVGELLRTQKFVLLDCTGDNAYADLKVDESAVEVLSGIPTTSPPELLGVQSVLLRPDGYLAWVSTEAASLEEADREIHRWLDLLP